MRLIRWFGVVILFAAACGDSAMPVDAGLSDIGLDIGIDQAAADFGVDQSTDSLSDLGADQSVDSTQAPAIVSGVVRLAGTPVPGAVVRDLAGSVQTTTDNLGNFSLSLPPNQAAYLKAEFGPTVTPNIRGLMTPGPGQTRSDIVLALVTNQFVDDFFAMAGLTRNPTKGIVAVGFGPMQSVIGGESADISLNYEAALVSESGSLVIDNTLRPGGTNLVVFANVDDGLASLTLMSNTGQTCVPVEPIAQYFVAVGSLSEIQVSCSP